MNQPTVAVICPTTPYREKYNERLMQMFYAQDYPNKVLLVDTGAGTIGAKRNRLCAGAKTDIILHMDSDDRYNPRWISKSVYALMNGEIDIVGLSRMEFHREEDDAFFGYMYNSNPGNFLCGATLCYWKGFWGRSPFPDKQIGEDWGFTHSGGARVHAHGYIDGYLGTIHKGNTSQKVIDGIRYQRLAPTVEDVLRHRWGINKETNK